MAVQRFNSVLLHGSLTVDMPDLYHPAFLFLSSVFNPGDLYYLGYKT